MEKFLDRYKNPALIGLLQAIAVVVYASIVAGFFFFMESTKIEPGYFGIVLMLVLLVFSAGITGTFVFGVPAYLAFIKNNVGRAISTLAYTFFYILLAIVLAIFLILAFAK